MWAVSRTGIMLETLAGLRRLRQAARQVEARVIFTVRHEERLRPLPEELVRQYRRDGYLLVGGLIPESVVHQAEAAMWQELRAGRQDAATWALLGPPPPVLRDPRALATYTRQMVAAAAQLAGEDVASFPLPRHTLAFNRRPTTRPWAPHPAHLDRIIPEMRYRTRPRSYRIGALTYLTTVRRHGGGTIVWPGSHLRMEALARTDPRKYRYLAALNAELGRVELGEPIELTPSAGDVLFHDHLFVHASSENVSDTPRLALNHKW